MVKLSSGLVEGMKRMGPLKDPVALLIFSMGAEGLIHEHKPEEFPRVTTRGHFDVWRLRMTPFSPEGRLARLARIEKEDYLTDGHNATDYGTEGDTAVLDASGNEAPDEIAVFVHGWLAGRRAALGRFSLMRHCLERNGYTHPVIGYTWDTRQMATEWRVGKVVGRWNGPKLARFTTDYLDANPDTKVRYISNSLGAHPVFSALKTLHDAGERDVVESVSVLGGTTPCATLRPDGEYHEAVEEVASDVYNYWTPHDGTLRRYYPLVEHRNSIGGRGVPDDAPDNLHDRRVEHVPDHFSYFLPERGCVPEVAEDMGVDVPDEVDPDALTRRFDAHPFPIEIE